MNTLEHWEERLKPYYNKGLRIIGEIPFTYADLESMAEAVGGFVRKNGRKSETTEILTRDYPLTFITLMSGFAAYNIEQNFWQAFADFIRIDLTFISNQGWRYEYKKIAEAQHLKVFSFEDAATPYVTSIRYQGGIPMHSLPDYFGKMVLPAVQRLELREISPADALDYLLKHSYFVDAPVLNFLEFSGELGVEFFAESCRLARHALEKNGEVLPLDEVNLPEYVVAGFDKFIETACEPQQRWSRPFLQVAPYSEDTAVHVILPEQEISLDLSGSQLKWKVAFTETGEEQVIPCRMVRRRQSVISEQVPVPIQSVVHRVDISIISLNADTGEERELRCWILPVIPAKNDLPVMVFDEDGIQTGSSRMIPAGTLYFLLPVGGELKGQGEIRKVEDFGHLVGAWSNWKTERWNVSQALSVALFIDGLQQNESIPVHGVIATPELTGGHLFQYQQYPQQPLYTSGPPSIRIPLLKSGAVHSQLSDWRVQVRSLWESSPNINTIFSFSTYEPQVILSEERAELPLQCLLGKNPAGLYKITVSGPRSLKAEFTVRLWPKLIISDHSTELHALEMEPKPYQFRLHLPEGASCKVQAGADPVEIEYQLGVWKITAPAYLEQVLLDLVLPAGGTSPVRVPVNIPLPTLYWALAASNDPGSLPWGEQVLQYPIDQLSQAGSAALHFRMYGLSNLIQSLRLRLVDINDERVVLQEAKLTRTDFSKDWLRVTLGQFADTLKQIHSIGQFELYQPMQANGSPEVVIPIMELTRALDIRDVELEQIGDLTWKLNWKEEHPLKNRRVMLVPAWQPWQKPWEYKIPNKVRGQFMLSDVALPPSRYYFYFYISPDWVPPHNQPPVGIMPHVIDLCQPEERLKALTASAPSDNLNFQRLMEQACIYDNLGKKEERDNKLSESAKHLIHLTRLELLVGTIKWMEAKDINLAVKSFFFNKMFNLQLVTEMLANNNSNSPALKEYLDFTARVKTVPSDSAKLILCKSDHSTAIPTCLRVLLQKYDPELPGFIIMMMVEARLSSSDAIDLLKSEPSWAIDQVVNLPVNPYTDGLLARLLPLVLRLDNYAIDHRLSSWMERALPFQEDEQIILEYLTHMFTQTHPGRFSLLTKYAKEHKIHKEDVMKLLAMDPKTSIEVLRNSPQSDETQGWIDLLEETYPSLSGKINTGSKLNTPFGVMVVDYIETKSGIRDLLVRLGDPDTMVYATLGDDAERLKLILDFGETEILITGQKTVWQCRICGYINPDERVLIKHFNLVHRYTSISMSKQILPLSFDPEEITLLLESQNTGVLYGNSSD